MLRNVGFTFVAAFSLFAFACTSTSTSGTSGSSGSSGSSGDGSSGGSDGGASSGTPGASGPALPETAFLYVSRESSDKQVLTAWDLATNTKSVVTDLMGDGGSGNTLRGYAIAPDRKSIALASLFEPTDADVKTGLATRRIHTMSIDGKTWKRLTPVYPNTSQGRSTFSIEISDPVFSRDGSEIFFGYGEYWYQNTELQGGSAIWKVATSGAGLPSLAWPIPGCSVTSPSTDPKTGKIAVNHSVCTDRANTGIWLHAPDGSSAPVKLVGGSTVDPSLEPVSWAKDGSGFAFVGVSYRDFGGTNRNVRGAFLYDDASKQVFDLAIPTGPDDAVRDVTLAPDASAAVYCLTTGVGDQTRYDLHLVDLTKQPFQDVALTNDGKSCNPRW